MIKEELEKVSGEQLIFRRLLCYAHDRKGHIVYMDDGEMTCLRCQVDFNTDSAEEIERKISEQTLIEIAAFQAKEVSHD